MLGYQLSTKKKGEALLQGAMQTVGYATICVEKGDKRLCKPIFLDMGKIPLERWLGLPLERQTEWKGVFSEYCFISFEFWTTWRPNLKVKKKVESNNNSTRG